MEDLVEHRYGRDDMRLVTASFRTHRFVPHAHSEYAVAAIERGVEAVRYRGATEHAPAGSLLLLDADTIHAGRPGIAEGWDYRVFYIPQPLLVELAGHRPAFSSPTPHDPRLAARLIRLHRRQDQTSLAAQEEFEALCSEILARYTRRGIAPAPSAPIRTAPSGPIRTAPLGPIRTAPLGPIQKVQRHLAEDLRRTPSLDELAQVAGLPRFQLLRAFRRETGVTPHGYLLQLRLRCAQQLLTAGHTVARAAAESGFYDQAHLHRHFRRTFAATPGRFARNDVQDRRRSRA
ncbi:AraC family transcriptional regulator [Microbispora hainanensis]|uniref:AraC family transcriptional regulator n=1 Tax=Microbispora hainanensis TaxID=568844 RepID=A0A544Z2F1_9ACTN|nr:AraC family transcriptional regulator [Microbispora hainanensis]TQS23239.1 AraC family transcriptional regulator [Microbispora hainanensis]